MDDSSAEQHQSRINPYLAHFQDRRNAPGRYSKPSDAKRFAWRPTQQRPRSSDRPSDATKKTVGSHKKNKRNMFVYGNYDNYYGYRDGGQFHKRVDPRLDVLDRSWFSGKRTLDLGCNAGWVTTAIGMLFEPKTIEGVDIDPSLIRKARSHLAYRASTCHAVQQADDNSDAAHLDMNRTESDSVLSPTKSDEQVVVDTDYFPVSCAATMGPLPIILHEDQQENPTSSIDPLQESASLFSKFPCNVRFRCGDWLHEPPPRTNSDRYDVILALSITKWIHLHHGDSGIRQLFQRCYQSLTSGGIFILEPQMFATYAKRAGLTDEMQKRYRKISLKPEMFKDYLTSSEFGFRLLKEISVHDQHESDKNDAMQVVSEHDADSSDLKHMNADKKLSGFMRPIYVFVKPNES